MPEQPEVERAVRRARAAAVGRRIATSSPSHAATRRTLDDATIASLRGRASSPSSAAASISSCASTTAAPPRALPHGRRLDVGRGRRSAAATCARARRVRRRRARRARGSARPRDDRRPRRRHRLPVARPGGGRRRADADGAARGAAPPPRPDQAGASRPARPRRRRQHLRGRGCSGTRASARARLPPRSAPWRRPSARRHPLALADGARAATRYTEGPAEAALEVYGREGADCRRCGRPIRRIVQAGRSTYYCPRCQAR